jgi:hypothetical protein
MRSFSPSMFVFLCSPAPDSVLACSFSRPDFVGRFLFLAAGHIRSVLATAGFFCSSLVASSPALSAEKEKDLFSV